MGFESPPPMDQPPKDEYLADPDGNARQIFSLLKIRAKNIRPDPVYKDGDVSAFNEFVEWLTQAGFSFRSQNLKT